MRTQYFAEEGFLCSFCKEPSAGGPMYGIVNEKGEPVCACWIHFFQVRHAQKGRFVQRYNKKQARKALKKGL